MTGHESAVVYHPFAPICDVSSRILILGSMPSVWSRRKGYYYGHPQNRFWPLLARLFQKEIAQTDRARREMILQHQLALWDVLQQCRIRASADSSIQEEKANPVDRLMEQYAIKTVLANGQTAGRLYRRYIEPLTHRPILVLPSTSPANARFTMADLVEQWRIMLQQDRTDR